MTLEVLKELFGVTHIGEEVPNTKPMRIGEEEVSLSQPITVVVPLEEEEDPVSQGPVVMVPPEEDEVLVPQAPPPITIPPKGRGCLIVTVPEDEGPIPTW
jgi:hypothetical protein